jgi:small-conductance mechanosensitive channel
MDVRPNRVRVVACWMTLLMLALSPFGVGQVDAPNSSDQVMGHLNQVLHWSRQWDSADIYLSRAGDEVYVDNGRSLAQEVVRLEFQSALSQAALIGELSPKGTSGNSSPDSAAAQQNIFNMIKRLAQQMHGLQTQLDTVNRKLVTARAKERPALMTQRDTLQGQLQLAQALDDDLDKLTAFMSSAETANGVASELTSKIVALQRAIPGAAIVPASGKGGAKSTPEPQRAAPVPVVSNPKNEGLIGQMGELVHFVQSMRTLTQMKNEATQLQTSTKELRRPLLTALRSTLQQGQIELANTAPGEGENAQNGTANSTARATAPQAATAAPSAPASQQIQTPEQKQQEMSALVQHFKLLSSATLPLSQELILLGQSQANLTQLQASLKHDYVSILRTLLIKVATLLIVLGFIWLFSELWRRATFRYIHDARRRRQFLVLRRVVTGFCMFVVILLGFVSDFSSLATYAGLITAGVAVALQAVILSVAAYFFLVGRYGVKVGDRVTVVYNGSNSVAGDVVDIGLVRFYMMELVGSGIDMQPTGRICVFPNSVLFQTNPLFKQMPGTEYTWREIALPLSADGDGKLAEKELLTAVESMYSGYKPMLERQHVSIESTMGVYMDTPKPYTRMRFVSSGLEVMVRYPIPLRQAAELDDRMVTEVTELLRKNPSIKLAAGSSPDLRSPVKV